MTTLEDRVAQLERLVDGYRDANNVLATERNYAIAQCQAHMKRIAELERKLDDTTAPGDEG